MSDVTPRLLLVVGLLTTLGTVMIASASLPASAIRYDNPTHFLAKHLLALALGVLVFWVCARISYRRLMDWDDKILLVAFGLMALTLIPGLTVRGSWLRLPGPFQIQPTEFFKLALIISLAAMVTRKGERVRDFTDGPLAALAIAGVGALIALKQSDFAMAFIFLVIASYMLFLGGGRLLHLVLVALAALPVLTWLIVQAPYRFARFLAFLDPFRYSTTEGYQLIQSLTAIGSGGLLGRGLGESREKLLYLPEPYNDFIFAIIGEELGLVGALVVIGLFLSLGYLGYSIALRASDRFGALLASGITFTLLTQAAINLGVATGLLPVTGLTLPFISYGGSSLIVSLAMVGILVNIAQGASGNEDGARLWGRDGRASLSRLSDLGRVE
ncbi:MAG: putative lipid II flippase FtsW [Candidatus Bipolaricaulota bacterium]|nr:putative lipid II flippase FtsW [Candidatus Bipolaricaulota bacterium]MCS7274440.1 putative lipid II flippase FtsW [Candidatus Bipolaricaulota bacterium]MDW8110869.1 putative lipid II flippase FtsW [Candidatus Bipolaricaulota bacterium]MDW8328650.1 putative lipid II flippase FtsW [Candidatus Bipolaricaulota bacterium]